MAQQPRGSCPAVNKPTLTTGGLLHEVLDEGCCVQRSAWGARVPAGNQVAEVSHSALRGPPRNWRHRPEGTGAAPASSWKGS